MLSAVADLASAYVFETHRKHEPCVSSLFVRL